MYFNFKVCLLWSIDNELFGFESVKFVVLLCELKPEVNLIRSARFTAGGFG